MNGKTKSQFKWLNILVISVGFLIIFLSLLNLAIIFFELLFLYVIQYFLLCLIFSLISAFYGFLAIFMFVITNIVFKDNEKNKMKTKKNPPIKNKFKK